MRGVAAGRVIVTNRVQPHPVGSKTRPIYYICWSVRQGQKREIAGYRYSFASAIMWSRADGGPQ